ncbi:MAG: hypothetical protein ACREBI_04240 [Nitrosotalea sp.]
MNHVVIDTDILSTFIKVDRVNLLERLFVKSKILLTPSVYGELKTGQKVGMIKLTFGARFSRIKLELAEKRTVREIRNRKLSTADLECIAVAKCRRCILVTNDSDVEKEADYLDIEHLNLPGILRLFWRSDMMTKARVNELIDDIEEKDRIIIKNKSVIFI